MKEEYGHGKIKEFWLQLSEVKSQNCEKNVKLLTLKKNQILTFPPQKFNTLFVISDFFPRIRTFFSEF